MVVADHLPANYEAGIKGAVHLGIRLRLNASLLGCDLSKELKTLALHHAMEGTHDAWVGCVSD